jgi:peroxiredoxin/predicted 2-oxoglutarate/Fe(II)-dependent dioxygenase YbiX
LPLSDGINHMFYADVKGHPTVLFTYDSVAQPDRQVALKSIADKSEEIFAAGADIFALGGDSVKAAATAAKKLKLRFPLFCDTAGRFLGYYLAPGAPKPPAIKPASPGCRTFVLDSNQRILTVIEGGKANDHGRRAVEFLSDYSPPWGEPLALNAGAPILLIPNVLEPQFRRELIDLWERGHEEGSVSSAYGNVREEVAKKSLDHPVRDPRMIERISETLARRIAPELQKVFVSFQPFAFDGHVILSYGAERDDFFGLHRDNLGPLAEDRRFAMSMNLNDDFEGGGLRFPEYGPHTYYPPAGTACVFSCSILHEALPVTKGRRWVLTTFFRDLPRQADGQPGAMRR